MTNKDLTAYALERELNSIWMKVYSDTIKAGVRIVDGSKTQNEIHSAQHSADTVVHAMLSRRIRGIMDTYK